MAITLCCYAQITMSSLLVVGLLPSSSCDANITLMPDPAGIQNPLKYD